MFILLGIPILFLAQFTDVYYFFQHSFGLRRANEADARKHYKFDYFEFKKLYRWLNRKIEKEGQTSMNTKELVL